MSEVKVYKFVRPVAIKIADSKLWVTLEDERVISTPLHWYSWLAEASSEQQNRYELLPDAIYWTDLNEGLEVEGMLRGIRPSSTEHKKLATEN
jgi:uncharacterized protein DUF2442